MKISMIKKFTSILLFLALFCPVITSAQDLKTSLSEYHKIKETVKTASSAVNTSSTTGTSPLLDAQKNQLIKIISILVGSLNDQKTQMLSLQSLSQTQKDQLSQVIQSSVDKFITENTQIGSVATSEGLKTASKAILDLWITSQSQFKRNTAQFLVAQLENLTADLESQLIANQAQSTTLKGKNKDTTRLDAKLHDNQNLLTQLKNNNVLIDQKISSIAKDSALDAVFQDILKSVSVSNSLISNIHATQIEVLAEINRLSSK